MGEGWAKGGAKVRSGVPQARDTPSGGVAGKIGPRQTRRCFCRIIPREDDGSTAASNGVDEPSGAQCRVFVPLSLRRRLGRSALGQCSRASASFFARRNLESSYARLMQIKVWLARGPNCPHAVESTASLLEIVLRDTEAVGTSQRPSQQELRLAYSMALIRWVVCQFRSVGLLLT